MGINDNNQSNRPVSIHDTEATFAIIEETILGLWQVVNNLTRVQPPKCDRYRVTIFGSARLQPHTPLYNGVKYLASQLANLGCDIITGGGPGLMQAANEGSVIADPHNRTKSIGIRVDLDFEQETNPFVEHVYQHQTFFTRLHHFVLLSNAFVVVPGGIGTTLEALMIWQLLQVRQLDQTPFIMVGEMWDELIIWAEKYMVNSTYPMANPHDIQIPICVQTFDEAVEILSTKHQEWTQSCSV
ncbi:LOG family protein [Calothrix sp. NIES-3974]|uniref:LOG family protein n=1 Tax=Calothrix sp. NIES-3974 TaxID=2005462 RepID=UPI000B5FF6E1|nr:LOG family protein [Calothrix sp. NIES-3974]BAZ04082.1 putative lysine decarboxylase [Calothrix sp. NIES-3974]